MQKTTYISRIVLYILSLTVLFALGCKKDDDPDKKNEVKYKTQSYSVTEAKVVEVGNSNFLLGLSSKDVNFEAVSGDLYFTGNGTLALFQLIGNYSGELENGTYYFSASTTLSPMTVINSWLYFDYDFTNQLGTSSYITSGTIEITLNDSKGVIEIDMSDPSGADVTGYYNGLIEFE